MSLSICVILTWLVIIFFSLIPKRLSTLDMIFLFFVDTIFELSIFTILHLNLHLIVVSKSVEKSLSDLVLRLIMIPIFMIISSNILLYSSKYLKWFIVFVMILSSVLLQWLLEWIGVISIHHWNAIYTVIMFSSYVLFSRIMTWFIIGTGWKEVKTE